MENVPRMPSRYLMMYFAETDLQRTTYRVMSPSGVPHQIPTQVVLEHIAQTGGRELRQIEDIIRKIDFKAGDVHHFLEHLATAIAAGYEQDGGMITGSQDLKGQLIKLGHTAPELRPNLEVVLRHLEASSHGPGRVARSLRVLMSDMKADLGRRGVIDKKGAENYISNLAVDADLMKQYDERIARSLRVLASDMKADIARRGEISAQAAESYFHNLSADLKRIEALA